jgi:hypothetical protein
MNLRFMEMILSFASIKWRNESCFSMERKAVALALALTLPLALYGIPYAYALTTQNTYVVKSSIDLTTGVGSATAMCSSPTDSTQHYGYTNQGFGRTVLDAFPVNSGGTEAATGQTPNGWHVVMSSSPGAVSDLYIICQSAITVAGIGVPEFGSLYVAIALGAVAYFVLSRHFKASPAIPAKVGV